MNSVRLPAAEGVTRDERERDGNLLTQFGASQLSKV
uniref:Uncharacterized protein n=1 Tax=Nelumbo nucifera TaxID=4432 RepID=A0A822Y0M1_NELNU|nr:TPA_asm: hypothetical protein HUJ06_026260 [Nelumbo nucifera]